MLATVAGALLAISKNCRPQMANVRRSDRGLTSLYSIRFRGVLETLGILVVYTWRKWCQSYSLSLVERRFAVLDLVDLQRKNTGIHAVRQVENVFSTREFTYDFDGVETYGVDHSCRPIGESRTTGLAVCGVGTGEYSTGCDHSIREAIERPLDVAHGKNVAVEGLRKV